MVLSLLTLSRASAFTYDSTVNAGSIVCALGKYEIGKDGYNADGKCTSNAGQSAPPSLSCPHGEIAVLNTASKSSTLNSVMHIDTMLQTSGTSTLTCKKYVGLKVYQDHVTQSVVSNDRFEGNDAPGELKVGLKCERVAYDVDTGAETTNTNASFSAFFGGTIAQCTDHIVEWQVLPQNTATDSSGPASPDDFVGGVYPSGRVRYANGQYQGDISIQFKPDTVFEKNKNFIVTLTKVDFGDNANAVAFPERGAKFMNPTLASTIINDDGDYPVFEMVIPNQPVLEGDDGDTAVTLDVYRTGNLKVMTGVAVRTSLGSDPNSADANDFKALNEILVFNPGVSKQETTLYIHGDKTFEPDETFYVNGISDFSGSTWLNENNRLTVTIKNDDLQPTNGWALYSETGSDTVAEPNNSQYPNTIKLKVASTVYWMTPSNFGISIDGLSKSEVSGVKVTPPPENSGFNFNLKYALSSTATGIYVSVSGDLTVPGYNLEIGLADDNQYQPDRTITANLVPGTGFVGVINHPSVSFKFIDADDGWAIPAGNLVIEEGGK